MHCIFCQPWFPKGKICFQNYAKKHYADKLLQQLTIPLEISIQINNLSIRYIISLESTNDKVLNFINDYYLNQFCIFLSLSSTYLKPRKMDLIFSPTINHQKTIVWYWGHVFTYLRITNSRWDFKSFLVLMYTPVIHLQLGLIIDV